MSIQTRPIVTWPGKMTPHNQRSSASYRAGYESTRRDLLRELEHIHATNAFIQAAYHSHQLRVDGLPKGGAAPSHPGVILTFTTTRGTYQMPCDTFKSAEHNLRAIVLTLQRLRLIEETGIKTHGRQYEGFKQLPAGDSPIPEMTPEEASAVVFVFAGYGGEFKGVLAGALLEAAYRDAAKRTHPDRHGGSDADFKKLQAAMEVLSK